MVWLEMSLMTRKKTSSKSQKPRARRKFSLKSKSQKNIPAPLTYEGFRKYIEETKEVETLAGKKTETKISHASGPIPNYAKLIETASLNPDVEYDENIINNWSPHMSLSVADSISGNPLSGAEVDNFRNSNRNWVPNYFVNPMQDLDYLVIQAIARSTFVGPLMEAITKFQVGTGFKPELELINPDKDEDINEKAIEENQDVIDTLLGIDAQIDFDEDDPDHELDVPLIEKYAAITTVKNMFNRSALIFGYDKKIKVNGIVYKEIPSTLTFTHARDLGIIQVNPITRRMQSVQWRNAYYMVPTKGMIYMWNPWISAKTRNAWYYGDSLVMPMLDAGRVVRKNIGVNFNAMSEATWSGLFLMAIKPQGQDLAEKEAEYNQVVKNMVRGGPNVLLEDPDNVKFQNVDFNPKVKEFQELTEAMLRYQVACTGMPHSMFYDESTSNRATMIGKIQLAMSTVINPMRESDGRLFSGQWWQRWFRLIYKDKKPDLLKKFRIKMVFEDLRIEEWFDKVEAANEVDGRKQLTDEAYGQLIGVDNYQNKVDPDAETIPGGGDGKNSMTFDDGSKLKIKEPKEQLKAKTSEAARVLGLLKSKQKKSSVAKTLSFTFDDKELGAALIARDTVKLADLQRRLENIEKEIELLGKKLKTPNLINQRTTLENEKTQVEEEVKREEEFTHASSFIGTVTYTIDMQSMEIVINGRMYPYCEVPQRIFDAFKGAGSKGAYFNRSVKGIYEC